MEKSDFPFNEVLAEADKLLAGADNINIYQKFTCEKCKGRLTMDEPNTFYTAGTCDKCGHVTDIKKNGCNYLVVARAI